MDRMTEEETSTKEAIERGIAIHRTRIERWLQKNFDVQSEDAEDHVGQAVLQLWAHRATLKSTHPTSIGSWLRRAAWRSCRAARRRKLRLRVEPLEESVDYADTVTPGPEVIAIQRDVEWLWRGALNRLLPVRRQAVLRWAAGEHPAEIARELGIKGAQPGVRLHRWREPALRIARELAKLPTYTWFFLPERRIGRIAEIAGIDLTVVRDYTLGSDWNNADEHQDWLDTSSDEDIADWVLSLINPL